MSKIDDKLSAILEEAYDWLDRPQPEKAVLQHHGIVAIFPGRQADSVSLIPRAFNECAVFSFNKKGIFNKTDVAYLRKLINKFTWIQTAWNGEDSHQLSIALKYGPDPGEGSLKAVERYFAGCPKHNDVFCGRHKSCTWYSDGKAALVLPKGWH